MNALRSSSPFAAHAVCAAAGLRDLLRTGQFFMRVLSGAERWGKAEAAAPVPGVLSGLIARSASLADRTMTGAVNLWLRLTVPDWRKLPSPFTHGMMSEVMGAIREASFVANPLFNAYFYRASIHILNRFRRPPFLVLEHRVDAARRMLARDARPPEETEASFLARTLIAFHEAAPIARPGLARAGGAEMDAAEANLTVFATACVALLFAEVGKPVQELDEDQFFEIVGALIHPRLERIGALAARADVQALTDELADIKAMY